MTFTVIEFVYFQIEQYKNVVFYGPVGASKTFLAKKLAKCVQVSLKSS